MVLNGTAFKDATNGRERLTDGLWTHRGTLALSTSGGTGPTYTPVVDIKNPSPAAGSGAFLRFTTGSGWSTMLGTVASKWWFLFADGAGGEVFGWDGQRLKRADDIGWTVPSFTNGWGMADGTSWPVGYRKMPDGRVIMRGLLSGGTGATHAFILPPGYRPLAYHTAVCANAGGVVRSEVRPDGFFSPMAQVLAGSNGGWTSICENSFLAEQ